MEHSMLQLLQKCKTIKQLKQTHLQIIVNGLKDDNFIVPKLISRSSDLSLDYAVATFESMNNPSVISYNTLIQCFIGKTSNDALLTYKKMRASMISPNSFTFTFLLRCFESFEALGDGEMVHNQIVKLGFESSVFVMNTLMDFYGNCCGDLGVARKVFDYMPKRDVVSWNTLIGRCMSRGEIESAIGLFESMPERSIVTWNSVISGLLRARKLKLAQSVFQRMPERNDVSWNTMLSGYVKVGDMETAQAIFNKMPERSVVSWTAMVSGYATVGDLPSARKIFGEMPAKNVVSWNAMIAGYVNGHLFDQALSVFHHMLIDGRCKPDQTTLVSVLSACAHLGSHDHGKWVDSYARKNKFELSLPLGNALIDMYAKCGDVENGRAVFQKMKKRCIITWTSIISGLAVNGYCTEALDLYDEMCSEGLKPDDVIFIAVLSACTHGGLVKEGKRVYDQMVHDFDITPRIEHYGCMVDLLGRAGKLEEALRIIESMHLQPNAVIWATLLSAFKIHGNGKLLESLTRKIFEQEPMNPGYLTLITNLSLHVGRWQDALDVHVASRQQGTEKVPGCSSIQIGNSVHEFLAKDTRHTQRKEVYRSLASLNGHLKSVYDMQGLLALALTTNASSQSQTCKNSG
ncbi:pentatricopeptide repeat-containing protein At3g29230-like [Coffea eugenioides]|uniref:pentatricopeptide repeat-containing protein At3g29230-like n=1 Tax=Coffea eugenioides TaxID=49369 RepID=UPI000F6053F6|nr:pentatricopeptide repeat-containing protein At3g29230-like [Coffea eugenioides]